MRHTIQRRPLDKQFRRLLREGSRAQRRPEERLAAKEGRLGQTAAMIPRVLFPASPALLPNRPQVLIPLPGGARTVALLPELGVPPRRNHGLRPPPSAVCATCAACSSRAGAPATRPRRRL